MISASAADSPTERAETSPIAWLPAAGLGAAAAFFLLWVMRYGVGASSDSVTYIDVARSVLAGRGLTIKGTPVTHYPPGYPLALALAGLPAGGDVVRGARFLHAVLFGLNVALAVAAVLWATRRSYAAAACVFCLYLASAPMLTAHATAWSEPLFITCTLAGLLSLARYLVRPRWRWLAGGALGIGLAAATRWVGVALLPAALLGVLLFGERTARRKIVDAVAFTAASCLPLAAVLAYNVWAAGSATNRTFADHPIGWEDVKVLIGVLYAYIFPVEVPGTVKAAQLGFFVVLLALGLVLLYRLGGGRLRTASFAVVYATLALLAAASYVALTLVSISFFDALTPIDYRIFLPVFALLAPAFVMVAQALAQTTGKPPIWWGFGALAFLSVTFNLGVSYPRVVSIRTYGSGYTAPVWWNSPTVAAAKALPPGIAIYSNGWDIIHFVAGRDAGNIPSHSSPLTREPYPNYAQQVQALCSRLQQGEAALVHLTSVNQRWFQPTMDELVAACGVGAVSTLPDGMIYGRADMLPAAQSR